MVFITNFLIAIFRHTQMPFLTLVHEPCFQGVQITTFIEHESSWVTLAVCIVGAPVLNSMYFFHNRTLMIFRTRTA